MLDQIMICEDVWVKVDNIECHKDGDIDVYVSYSCPCCVVKEQSELQARWHIKNPAEQFASRGMVILCSQEQQMVQ